MHPILTQLSGLAALLVLLSQLWGTASLERTLGVSVVAGLAVYGVLLVTQITLRYVLHGAPSASEAETTPAPPDAADAPPSPEPTASA